jgi:hypothetical protein
VELLKDFPEIEFVPGHYFMWSPYAKAITYDRRRINRPDGMIALLHEIGHARLNHRIYKYDAELIQMELDAWDIARELAPNYGLAVDENHVERCIATYDEWLTKRATCPDCSNFCLQRGRDEYSCFLCGSVWEVNWRKDRRVTRRVTSRYQNPLFVATNQFARVI